MALAHLQKSQCLKIQKELKKTWQLWKQMIHDFDHEYGLIEIH
jgi:Domain of unknown function (DUF4377)